MTIAITESKINDLYNNYEKLAERLLNLEVLLQLQAIKEKYNYERIEMISGMGTWGFNVWKKGKKLGSEDHKLKAGHFKELDEFLSLMAGQYKIYPRDCEVH